MTADKTGAGFSDERFKLSHHPGFHAADISNDRAGLERGQQSLHQRGHLGQRCAKDHEVGIGNRRQQIGGGIISRAIFFTTRHGLGASDKTGDFTGQIPLAHSQSNGTAQQTDANNGDFTELHGRKDSE